MIPGFFSSREKFAKRAIDYFLANRTLGSSFSYSATTYSAFMMVGLVGLTYRGGIRALGFELIYLSGLVLTVILGPKFWQFQEPFTVERKIGS